jgi:hypothetical protein
MGFVFIKQLKIAIQFQIKVKIICVLLLPGLFSISTRSCAWWHRQHRQHRQLSPASPAQPTSHSPHP